MKNNKIGRIVWTIKIGMVFFGYLILAMLQHTFNPINFNWVATILFTLWALYWLKSQVNKKDEKQ